jgi:hypothetical protein
MLAFDPTRRPTARQAGEEWERLLRSWVRPGNRESVNPQAAAHELAAYMRAVLAREAGMSAMQWEKVLKGIATLSDQLEAAQLADLESLRARIKTLRESGDLR